MLKIEAVLQPSKLDAVKDALLEAGIEQEIGRAHV